MYNKNDKNNIIIGIVGGILLFILILVVGAVSHTGDISQDPSLKYSTGIDPPTHTATPTPEDTEQPQPTTQKANHDLSDSAPPVVDVGY